MKALVGAFNQEKALVGAFSMIVKTGCGTDGSFYSTRSHPALHTPPLHRCMRLTKLQSRTIAREENCPVMWNIPRTVVSWNHYLLVVHRTYRYTEAQEGILTSSTFENTGCLFFQDRIWFTLCITHNVITL